MVEGRRVRRSAGLVAAGIGVVAGGAVGRYVWNNRTYADRGRAAVRAAGFVEKRAVVDGVRVNYAEGPDNGPALLLIHGQSTDWRGWSPVLPGLARRHHVFAVDCLGHGGSAHVPAAYTAPALTAGMVAFLEQVVGRPATVAGHSSGGLIAGGVAAAAPERVRGLVLEDPPFFSTLLPRAKTTFNHVGLATIAHRFLSGDETDFTGYFLREATVMWRLFGRLGDTVRNSALTYHRAHPGRPVTIWYMPPTLNEAFRALDTYDPRFGEAFYTGSFNDGFGERDQERLLSAITCPVAQIHVKERHDADGVLQAAMSEREALRTRGLLPDVRLYDNQTTGHNFHFDAPAKFDRILRDLEDRISHGVSAGAGSRTAHGRAR